MTYRELDQLSQALGAWFQAQGLKPGDRVALMLPNIPQFAVTMAAILRAGYTCVNVNPLYTARELEHQLKDSGASAIVILENFAHTLAEVIEHTQIKHTVLASMGDLLGPVYGRWITFAVRHLAKMVPPFELPLAVRFNEALSLGRGKPFTAPAIGPDDIAVLQYTGGTTGMPKGVMWRQGDALVECFGGSRFAQTIEDFVAETKGRMALVAPPFMHGAGHWVAFGSWNAGGTVFVPSIPDRLDADDIWSMVEQEKIDFLLIVGDAFARPLIDQLKVSGKFSKLPGRHAIIEQFPF